MATKKQKHIVRTYSAGVFYGTIKSRNGKEVVLSDAIRLWYWSGAFTLSQLAAEGTINPGSCKFAMSIPEILVTEAIEIIPVTQKAARSIEGVKPCKV